MQPEKGENGQIAGSAAKEEEAPEIKQANARIYLFG